MKILFYTPLNSRCRDIESQAIEFHKAGHKIFLLTQSEYSVLHENFMSYGFSVEAKPTVASNVKILILKRVYHLVTFCLKNKIDIVYSHLEPSNFISVLAQFFIRSRVLICRHHVDEPRMYPYGKDLSYKLTYKFCKEVIVVSKKAKDYMIHNENVPIYKIHQINLAYDFSLYGSFDAVTSENIRKKYKTPLLLLTVCRLTEYKRPDYSIELVKELIDLGLQPKLIILGKGELSQELEKLIVKLNLQNNVFMPGYVNNVLDYMAAADLLIHPSLIESSCISLKEAALVNLPIVACKGIGDFDEVIINEENGFSVDANNFIEETVEIILKYGSNHDDLKRMGRNIEKRVRKMFDIKTIAPYYENTFHTKKS